MNCAAYVRASYVRDLQAFRAAYSKIFGRDLRSMDRMPPYMVHVFEGDSENVRNALRAAAIQDPHRFLIVLFLEGALLAGVHSFDPHNYEKYRRALPYEVFIEAFPNLTVRHPQTVLAAAEWPDPKVELAQGCTEFLTSEWAKAYDRLIGEAGSGRKVLAEMGRDLDLAWGGAEHVPENLAGAYMRGLRSAANRLQ